MWATVQSVAKSTVKTIQLGVSKLGDAPTDVPCDNCPFVIMVPATTFDWPCDFCGVTNTQASERCSHCSASKGSTAKSKVHFVQCTMCQTTTQVPSTNAAKTWKLTSRKATKLARKGSAALKKEVERQKSCPKEFHCGICGHSLENPNFDNPNGSGVESLLCTVCHGRTRVPGSTFTDGLSVMGKTLKRGVSKVKLIVTQKASSNCPICSTACEIPVVVDEEGHPKRARRYQVYCCECRTSFPATH